MINNNQNPVAWALLLTELDEAREHLDSLTEKMIGAGAIEDSVFSVDLGHIYAHLNRAWHCRNQYAEISNNHWSAFSQFPKDISPVG